MVGQTNLNRLNGVGQSKSTTNPVRTLNRQQLSFEAVLTEQLQKQNQELHLSKHAKQRVEQRGITVDSTLMNSLNEAAKTARQKGAMNTVMIGQEAAFVVNIPSGVIVTAISAEELKTNMFTNIDSAILL